MAGFGARLGVPFGALLAVGLQAAPACAAARGETPGASTELPDGQYISPTAAPGAVFQSLDPHLPDHRDYRAVDAVKTALSPDGNTLLVMTSGYNLLNYTGGPNHGKPEPSDSTEYIFVFDVRGEHRAAPVQKQV